MIVTDIAIAMSHKKIDDDDFCWVVTKQACSLKSMWFVSEWHHMLHV